MNSLDKMEEDRMREAFKQWHFHFDFGTEIDGSKEAWDAAIKYANSQHSKVIEDYDRLAKLCEKQAMELETLQYRLQGEFDLGMDAARKEVQTVEVGENSPDSLEDWIGDKPVMRIQFYSDSGDMSVGIWPTSGWEVSADQSGTVLEELLSSLSAANATIAMLRKNIHHGNGCAKVRYSWDYECSCGVDVLLNNTQAAAEAFLAEHDAKHPDKLRMDWMVGHCVEVRDPLLHGSRYMFTAQTMTDEEDAEHRTDLREQIDRASANRREE